MEYFASQDPRFNSFYFDLNIWFRARKVIGTFEKRAPVPVNRKVSFHFVKSGLPLFSSGKVERSKHMCAIENSSREDWGEVFDKTNFFLRCLFNNAYS